MTNQTRSTVSAIIAIMSAGFVASILHLPPVQKAMIVCLTAAAVGGLALFVLPAQRNR